MTYFRWNCVYLGGCVYSYVLGMMFLCISKKVLYKGIEMLFDTSLSISLAYVCLVGWPWSGTVMTLMVCLTGLLPWSIWDLYWFY